MTHHKILWMALAVFAIGLLAFALSGCASRPEGPPMPPSVKFRAPRPAQSQQIAPKRLGLVWDNLNGYEVPTRIWTTRDFKEWAVLTNTLSLVGSNYLALEPSDRAFYRAEFYLE
jgi:hypothetical protein